MAPAGCCGSRRRASSRERSRRIGPGGGWRPAVNGPGRLLRGLAGRMRSRCVPCTGACAPSPMPRLLRPVPAFPVFCCPRPVARVLRPAPRARVFRLLHFVPPFPVFCCPRPVARVLRPASCTPCPRAPVPVPAPRARARVHVLRVPCSAFRVLRPAPHARVFRVPRPAPAPAAPLPCALCPWPRTRVSCAPCPWLRLLRPADGCPCSAPCLPPPHFGAGPSGFCKPQG